MPAIRTSENSVDLREPYGDRLPRIAVRLQRLPGAPHREFLVLLEELIKPERIACNVQARSKKHCLELLSELLAEPDHAVSSEEIFARLVDRERLGCTSLAQGTAFPHCRVGGLDAARAALLTLETPVEFDAVDGQIVDVVFGLIVPEVLEDVHYAAVDRVAELLKDAGLRTRLRAADNERELHRALAAADTGSPRESRSAGSG